MLLLHIWVMGKPVMVIKQSSGMPQYNARIAGPSQRCCNAECWLAAGFSVNGEAKETELMRKCGLKPGQVLILTKPLGSGVLFAADMSGKAKGSWVSGMQQRCVLSDVQPPGGMKNGRNAFRHLSGSDVFKTT